MHCLYQTKSGKYAIVIGHPDEGKRVAWHDGETNHEKRDHLMTCNEALEASQMNNLIIIDQTIASEGIVIDDSKAVVLLDQTGTEPVKVYIGTVGKGQRILQHVERFNNFNDLIAGKQIVYSAMVLNDGRRGYISAELPMLNIGKEYDMQLTFGMLWGNDGSCAETYILSGIYGVCANTIQLSYQEAEFKATIKHTEKMDENRIKKQDIFDKMLAKGQGYGKIAEKLLATPISADKAKAFFEAYYGGKKDSKRSEARRENAVDEYMAAFRMSKFGAKGKTWHDVLMAGTFIDSRAVAEVNRAPKGVSMDDLSDMDKGGLKFMSNLVGDGAKKSSKLLTMIMAALDIKPTVSTNPDETV